MTGGHLFSIILLIGVATAAAQGLTDTYNCSYKVITKTGYLAGTNNSVIGLVFGDRKPFVIPDLIPFGIVDFPTNYLYFQRDRLDAFFFDGPCDLRCPVRLTHRPRDSGKEASWFVYFFIISASLTEDCDHTVRFQPDRWLNGTSEYQGNFCPNGTTTAKNNQSAAKLPGIAMVVS